MRKQTLFVFGLVLLALCLVLWTFLRSAGETPVVATHTAEAACAVLAHPDDETIISGTLAKLAAEGLDITVVYVTSGDRGADETGRGLHGEALGAEREKEAAQALEAIGIGNQPVFFRFPDGGVLQNLDSVTRALLGLFKAKTPEIVISFGPDGITGDEDHRMSGFASDCAFDLTDSGTLLLHMANSKELSLIYPSGIDVSKRAVNLRVNVANYTGQRQRAYDAHHTQFNSANRLLYRGLVYALPNEEFIIARSRNAERLLEKYFFH